MDEEIKPGYYYHFKGNVYKLLYTAIHTETGEKLAIYKSIKDGTVWARPASMWNDEVIVLDGGYTTSRFTFMKGLYDESNS